MSKPVVFGTRAQQEFLLALYERGGLPSKERATRLLKSGLIHETKAETGGARYWLDERHPAFADVLKVLKELGAGKRDSAMAPKPTTPHVIDFDHVLGHQGKYAFMVLLRLVQAGPLERTMLRRRIAGCSGSSIAVNIRILAYDGLVVGTKHMSLAKTAPPSLPKLVVRLGEALAKSNPILELHAEAEEAPWAFRRAADGAPRFFASDLRLRTLLALAKYGSLTRRELEIIANTDKIIDDARDFASFGRAGVVLTWDTPGGFAAALHPKFPLVDELRAFLIAVEKTYGVPAVFEKVRPPLPKRIPVWSGDREQLFGAQIPTGILTAIGVLGWTFEALCCEVIVGFHRENIKKAIHRLEEEGVLVGDRPRRPGFDIRKLTISPKCPGRAELGALLRAYVARWPQVRKSVEEAMDELTPKTKAHLKNRGLLME